MKKIRFVFGYLDKKMGVKKWGLGGKMVNFSKKIGVKYMI